MNLYCLCLRNGDSIELLNYVRQHLFIADNTLDTDLIAEDTDLVSFGIDSIQLLQLIAKMRSLVFHLVSKSWQIILSVLY